MDKNKVRVAIIDLCNCAKLALDRDMSGSLIASSSCFMKIPPKQFRDNIARGMTEAHPG